MALKKLARRLRHGAPVMEAGSKQRVVFLPAGASWKKAWTVENFQGGQTITVGAPLETNPALLTRWR